MRVSDPNERERVRALRQRYYDLCKMMPAAEAAAVVNEPVQPITAAENDQPDPRTVRHDPVDPGSVEIPENWRTLSWPERRSLAAKVSRTPVNSGFDVEAAIEAELKRRAAAA